ncbi:MULTISPECIES: hypothetical protein [unclassified Caulobacter]|uniref:hypothetical protein n=1 Tax=unclassified Caulobacter TaxID=2648921 RepID=UPI0011B36FF3|nr:MULTISPECIES: hypothetical protein [unclassified Caulobacter]
MKYREAALLGRRGRWDRTARLQSFDWRAPVAVGVTAALVGFLLTGIATSNQVVLPVDAADPRALTIGRPENTIDIFFFGRNEQPCGVALAFKADPGIKPLISQAQVVRVAPGPSSRKFFMASVELDGDMVRLSPKDVCLKAPFTPAIIETGAPPTNILARLISGTEAG